MMPQLLTPQKTRFAKGVLFTKVYEWHIAMCIVTTYLFITTLSLFLDTSDEHHSTLAITLSALALQMLRHSHSLRLCIHLQKAHSRIFHSHSIAVQTDQPRLGALNESVVTTNRRRQCEVICDQYLIVCVMKPRTSLLS